MKISACPDAGRPARGDCFQPRVELHAFRATGPDSDLSALMLRVAVREYTLPE
jgi:hypothetical protein